MMLWGLMFSGVGNKLLKLNINGGGRRTGEVGGGGGRGRFSFETCNLDRVVVVVVVVGGGGSSKAPTIGKNGLVRCAF